MAQAAASDRGFVSTPRQLIATAERLGKAPAYCVRGAEGWVATSWREFLEQVRAAARSLVALGVPPGGRVAILGFNRPEWIILDHAAMMLGGASVGIYWTSAAREVGYILAHSAAAVLLVENAAQAAKLEGQRAQLTALRQLVAMRGAQVEGALAWDGFLRLGAGAAAGELQAEVERRLAAIGPADLATLIYTSGTTGMPKAVMLTHNNLAFVGEGASTWLDVGPDDRHLSYLPLAHIAERVPSVINPAFCGICIYFARDLERMPEDLRTVRPTFFFGVPRVWEKMRASVEARLAQARGLRGRLLRWAMASARAFHRQDLSGRSPDWRARWRYGLARALVLRKLHAAMGLDAARMLVSGAAPIARDHLEFFLGLDLVIREVYGQSEDCGPATLNLPGQTRLGSVGRALPGVELRIAEDGEILVRGRSVFAGYLDDTQASAAALAGGWLHSGDLGRLDADGYLYITGRKKDLIITSGGKNVSPAALEAELAASPLIEHAVVVGDGRHFLTALLTLKAEAARQFAAAHGLAGASLAEDPRLRSAVQAEVDAVNERHSRVAAIRKFAILAEGFQVGSEFLTATMKLRRQAVIAAHRDLVESMYREERP